MRRWRGPFKRMTILFVVFGAIWLWASQDDLVGRADIIDGDSIEIGGSKIRLYGIDAPELDQDCLDRRGATYACGRLAKRHLEKVATGTVTCESVEQDRYGRAHGRDRQQLLCTRAALPRAEPRVRLTRRSATPAHAQRALDRMARRSARAYAPRPDDASTSLDRARPQGGHSGSLRARDRARVVDARPRDRRAAPRRDARLTGVGDLSILGAPSG